MNAKYIWITAVAVTTLMGCTNSPQPGLAHNPENTENMSDKKKEIVRQLYEECLNKRNYQLLDELIADNYSGIRGESGPAGFAATVTSIITAFPDIHWTIDDMIAEGDKVVIRWSWRGTHTGNFRELFPATGKEVEDRAIAIYQVTDSKITKAWIESDRLGFLQQIGILPQDLRMLASRNEEE